uniref:Alpha-2-macroglobulin-P-like n=1 Tax=Saccoglossus kowalevskii TaxID=10224 RepID=A0ABM0M223_SACKO|nr:PREDICTED: alpha-2-macroglobulin-P-like [Saccoglossus kowalevskii]
MASMMSKGDGRLGAPGLAGPVGAPEVVAIDSAFEMEAEENVIEDDLEFTPLVEIRTYFPETWLWQLETVGDNGEVDVNVEVPHTITEWIGSGFCTSSQFGVGVSDTTTLTAFQPFFLSYTLPYSVIRGEKVPVLISVFNYLSECLTIELVLTETDEFENMENSATKQVCVCGGESKAVTYQIVPKTLGEIPITVHAESIDNTICDNNAIMSNRVGVRDALSDDLLVEPEGIEQEFTYSNFICKEENEEFGIFQIELTLPDDVVKGSARGTVSSIGDLMGPTLSGLDRLLRIPCGCGEQTMVTFSPNIFVLQYLTATEQVTASISERAITNMRSGYQRELTYRHDDGSYSAFGERDPEGSTWLTAFVVKSFAQSKQFIFIDDDDLSMSIEWFKQQQRKDTGCFIKRGSVHNKRLKGGVSNDISLTAFVLIAMLEAGIPNNDFSVQLGLKCLEDNMNELNDVYPVAIITYAFALAGSEHKEFMMQKLNELATVEGHYPCSPSAGTVF